MDHPDIWKISEIINNQLYLSGIFPATSEQMLKSYRIDAIIRLGHFDIPSLRPGLTIDIEDEENVAIEKYFDICINFIDSEIKKGKKVLVHCMAGISRSVTIIIAYLMIKKNMSLMDAINYVKSKRKIAHPNEGFCCKLNILELKLKAQ